MFGGAYGAMTWMMILPGLFWLVVLVGLGLLVYALIQREQGAASGLRTGADDPLAILRVRYARGEITHEEFVRMKRELGIKGGSDE